MISLKRYLETSGTGLSTVEQTDAETLLPVMVEAYRSALVEMGALEPQRLARAGGLPAWAPGRRASARRPLPPPAPRVLLVLAARAPYRPDRRRQLQGRGAGRS